MLKPLPRTQQLGVVIRFTHSPMGFDGNLWPATSPVFLVIFRALFTTGNDNSVDRLLGIIASDVPL